MDVWGLTGNIACGKSAVEGLLVERGVPVIDLDVVAREVVEPGEPALAEIREAFGDGVLDDDGRLDRAALGAVVFDDAEARSRLQQITWPRIYERTAAKLAALGSDVAVVSAALMVESGSYRTYAGFALVTCTPEQQRARLVARDGLSPADADKRITSQMPASEKVPLADVVIDNSGPLDALPPQVDAWIATMRGQEAPAC